MTILLSVEGLSRRYADVEVLRELSLTVAAGEALAVTGPSGSGKSTLLRCLGGLERPDSGRIFLDGLPIESIPTADRARRIGFVFQEHYLLPQLSALENLLVPAVPTGQVAALRPRAEVLLARLGLAGRGAAWPAALSGGERQRLAVARALVGSPDLVLADEPTGSLDRTRADQVGGLLLELVREGGAALVLATHDPILAGRCDRNLSLPDLRKGW